VQQAVLEEMPMPELISAHATGLCFQFKQKPVRLIRMLWLHTFLLKRTVLVLLVYQLLKMLAEQQKIG